MVLPLQYTSRRNKKSADEKSEIKLTWETINPSLFFGRGHHIPAARKSSRTSKEGKGVEMMAIDPVCKMTVDESKAAATYDYKGKTYYFCAPGCRDAFSKDPEKFLKKEGK